jgi:hypothetical protein
MTMDLSYARLIADINEGTLRQNLERELIEGFQQIHASGELLPTASHFASRIAEIIDKGPEQPLSKDDAFVLYQEILLACENARLAVLGDEAEEERKRRYT